MSIEIRHVSKQFGQFQALRDVSLNIGSGELVALLGPSGCGKTTLLRIIAGLETPDVGHILFDGVDTTETHVRERQVGFVFQHYALFRHMTVFENVAFGLRVKPRALRPSAAHIREKVHALLDRVQLAGLADRYPSQLSGGQRQRVALARSLAVEPRVLLLDEPFGALDAKVRKELRRWLRRLHDELHVTSLFVTHDQDEALEVADRVVLMHQGQVEQVGTPQQVWDHPASPFVYGFLGDANPFHGQARNGQLMLDGVSLPAPDHAGADTAPAVAYVRPHELSVHRPGQGVTGMAVRLERALVVGPVARLELVPTAAQPEPGDPTGEPSGTAPIEAHLPAEVFRQQGFVAGEALVVVPKKARVFVTQSSSA